MVRNTVTALDTNDTHASHMTLNALVSLSDKRVTFTVTKRTDGTVSEREGTVIDYCGDDMMSNASVRVDTPSGERTFNLYLMTNVREV